MHSHYAATPTRAPFTKEKKKPPMKRERGHAFRRFGIRSDRSGRAARRDLRSCHRVGRLAILAAMFDDLLQRVALAQALPGEQAARALAGLWEELGEDAPVARLA